ncbi:uncharacterized protein LOC126260536 [Schistocerca nitens]|uniref:uncharacterized protein LOC126260536 n=1 Tax=Schistocerca nitens TaxID=7011 RepID=UPI00211820B2|nr:uncharacterized protein LOC126260536 [Schistocerca nitens]
MTVIFRVVRTRHITQIVIKRLQNNCRVMIAWKHSFRICFVAVPNLAMWNTTIVWKSTTKKSSTCHMEIIQTVIQLCLTLNTRLLATFCQRKDLKEDRPGQRRQSQRK